MKTKISQIAAVAFLALFIFTGNAKADGTERDASCHENIEAVLNIEPWMIDENVWNTGEIISIENTSEKTFDIESWMIDETIWNIKPLTITEKEQNLTVEPWMLNENIWN